MQLTNALLALSAVVAVTAHPSAQGHRHNHAKRATNWYHANRQGGSDSSSSSNSPAVDGNVKAESVATTTTSAQTQQSTTTSSAASPSKTSSSVAKDWSCTVPYQKRDADEKRATSANIAYVGNIGTPYGCNLMEIDSANVGQYDYTVTFDSPDYDVTCQCWNKIGKDGHGINGHWEDMLKLKLPKGSTKALAIQGDTQGACGCAVGDSVPTCPGVGYWLGTWVEFDMGSKVNVLNGVRQSGADVSVLTPMDCAASTGKKFDFPGMKIAANNKFCSGITANAATSYHAYVVGVNVNSNQDIHDADGVGCTGYGPNNLHVTIGDVKLA